MYFVRILCKIVFEIFMIFFFVVIFLCLFVLFFCKIFVDLEICFRIFCICFSWRVFFFMLFLFLLIFFISSLLLIIFLVFNLFLFLLIMNDFEMLRIDEFLMIMELFFECCLGIGNFFICILIEVLFFWIVELFIIVLLFDDVIGDFVEMLFKKIEISKIKVSRVFIYKCKKKMYNVSV